jgi:hypothetical protein
MPAVRVHRYAVDPGDLEKFLGQRTEIILAIKNNPAFAGAVLTRLEDGTYIDTWRWESAAQMQAALGAATGFPLVGATLAYAKDHSAQNGEIVDDN